MRAACRVSILGAFVILGNLHGGTSSSLKLVQQIPLPQVKGRIDHMAIDLKGRRLFVAALGNDTVEVVDLQAGKRVHTIAGLAEPQAVLYLADSNQLYITNGRTGECRVLDGASFQTKSTISFADDADNIRYDPAAHRVYVGYGSGAIGVVDGVSGKRAGDIKLSGHPESFQIEKDSGTIFVNVPSARQIAVLDTAALKVRAVWPLKAVQDNFPMALDDANHRLFVGTRKPTRLLVFDAQSGGLVQEVGIDGTTDDVFYDAARKRIYVACGTGFLDVIEQKDASNYVPSERISTAPGGRTCLLVPESGVLYLAVPVQKDRDAAIYIYDVNPSLRSQS